MRSQKCVLYPTLGLLIALAFSIWFCPPLASAQQPITLEIVTNAWHESVIAQVQASASRFEAANPGIKVEVRRRVGGWDQFVVQVVGGNPPNIVTTKPELIGEFAPNNVIIPIDDLVSRTRLREQVFGPTWDGFIYEGKTYGVPGIENGPRYGMVWNRQFLDEAALHVGEDDVMNWEEFLEFTHKLTRYDGEGNITRVGFDPRNGQNTRLWTAGPLWGVNWFDLETGHPQLNAQPFIDALELITDRVYRRYVPWVGGSDWYAIAAEKVAVANLGIYGPGEIENRVQGMDLVVSWPPQVERKRMQQVGGWGFSIPVGATHVEESMRLIEFLATDVQFQLDTYMNVGFLGVGNDFLGRLPSELTDPARLWYVTSMAQADEVVSELPHPFVGRATALFNDARNKVFTLQEPARQALDEVNRLLQVEMQEAGFIR